MRDTRQSAPGSRPQETGADLGLNVGDGFGTDTAGRVKTHVPFGSGPADPLDDDAVEMHMGIEQGAKDKAVPAVYGFSAAR
jgi:hypothetical protein